MQVHSKICRVPVGICVLPVAVLALLVAPARASSRGEASAWVTTESGRHIIVKTGRLPKRNFARPAKPVITVNTNKPLQSVIGFGAAMTDAAALLIAGAGDRREVMTELFDRGAGLGLSILRVPIGSTDFSTSLYSFQKTPQAEFSIAPIRDTVLPLLKEAANINPNLALIACPWSAPGWMKDNGSMLGVDDYLATSSPAEHAGSDAVLLPEFESAYAEYLAEFAAACRDEGLELLALSLQNEPYHTTKQYPSMHIPARQARRLSLLTAHELKTRNLTTGILVWEHNYEEKGISGADYVEAVYGDQGAACLGSAWHGYAGNPQAMKQVTEKYPAKRVLFTETTAEQGHNFGSNLKYMLQQQFMPALACGAQSLMTWNICVDENGGPRLDTVEWKSASGLLNRNRSERKWARSGEYAAIGHFSKFVLPGASVVESHGQKCGDLSWSAFRNPDGSVVVVLFNARSRVANIQIELEAEIYELRLADGAAATVVINAGE